MIFLFNKIFQTIIANTKQYFNRQKRRINRLHLKILLKLKVKRNYIK